MLHVCICFVSVCVYSSGIADIPLICSVSELTLISAEKHTTTLGYLLQSDVQYDIVLDTIALTDEVVEHQAIVSQSTVLVNSGELVTAQCSVSSIQRYTSAKYDENVLWIDEVWNLAGNMRWQDIMYHFNTTTYICGKACHHPWSLATVWYAV